MSVNASKEKFRVFLAEDEPDWIREVGLVIDELGGVLVETAITLEDALEVAIKLEELKIDLVILGGSLGEYKPGTQDSLEILIAMIKEPLAHPYDREIKTIGLSGDPLDRLNGHVDVNLGKDKILELAPTIISLLGLDEDVEEVADKE